MRDYLSFIHVELIRFFHGGALQIDNQMALTRENISTNGKQQTIPNTVGG